MREKLPDSTLDWVVEESFVDIAAMHPAVHRVIPVAVRRWRSQIARPAIWAEMRHFYRTLRADAYDCVIDTQGLLKSALITSRARGRKHGFDSESAREPIASRFYDVKHGVKRDMHAVDRNRMLTAGALGMKAGPNCDYGLVAPRGSPVPHAAPYCVLLTMTSRADKLWPEEYWVELVRQLAKAGLESLLPWGSEAEYNSCRRVVSTAACGVVLRSMSLRELASLIATAKVVFGVDTGLTHLAVALNAPTVGLFCGSDPLLTGLHGSGKLANLGGPGDPPLPSHAFNAFMALN